MARLADQPNPEAYIAQTKEHQAVCKEVTRRFGMKPESVKFLKTGCDLQGVCSVTVGLRRTTLLVFANGLLVGIPPKGAWRS